MSEGHLVDLRAIAEGWAVIKAPDCSDGDASEAMQLAFNAGHDISVLLTEIRALRKALLTFVAGSEHGYSGGYLVGRQHAVKRASDVLARCVDREGAEPRTYE